LKGTKPKDPLKVKARTKTDILHSAGRTEYQRGLFTSEPDGTIVVEQLGDQSSNRLSSFNNCNCLIEIPGTRGNLALNDEVTILPMVNFSIF
ncbi:MAG: molybdopterin molybdenumtransferase MoeA, partial [Gammaproteobacteria bacterium]|nr:molybdopterin molybdenumtransferase MoeA [Gammaproteobacteria bacterium]